MALNKSGRALLCDLVNSVNPTSFTQDQVTIGTPQPFVDTLPGTHNTQVTFHANNAPESVRTLFFTRLSLATLFQGHDLEFEVGEDTTPASVLAEINAIFETAIESGVDVAPIVIPAEDGIVSLTALPGSLTYVGSVDLLFTYPVEEQAFVAPEDEGESQSQSPDESDDEGESA